ncbi:hypothetical protein CYMTET_29593 [Cymbomonas tetramitiformis]|uniref:Uncharacterized protein n=1 Tax=Cymbomonas tetramitiformis TaxID=36881 RepID=A0AAE0FL39_9CHLO|nr:hypothetical protein CYMTET_29593 [Cymbomonas tetramitiformis]
MRQGDISVCVKCEGIVLPQVEHASKTWLLAGGPSKEYEVVVENHGPHTRLVTLDIDGKKATIGSQWLGPMKQLCFTGWNLSAYDTGKVKPFVFANTQGGDERDDAVGNKAELPKGFCTIEVKVFSFSKGAPRQVTLSANKPQDTTAIKEGKLWKTFGTSTATPSAAEYKAEEQSKSFHSDTYVNYPALHVLELHYRGSLGLLQEGVPVPKMPLELLATYDNDDDDNGAAVNRAAIVKPVEVKPKLVKKRQREEQDAVIDLT